MTLEVRAVKATDVPYILQFGEALTAESDNFNHVGYSKEALRKNVTDSLTSTYSQCWVALKDGRLIGTFKAAASKITMSDNLIVCDDWLYLTPDNRGTVTGGKAIKEFIRLYKDWANNIPNVVTILIGVSTGINEEQTVALLKRLGGSHYGTLLRL